MNKYHVGVLEEIKINKGTANYGQSTMGTTKLCYQVTVPCRRKIAVNFIKKYPQLVSKELITLLDYLFMGKSHEEITLGGLLLEYLPKLKRELNPQSLDKWLEHTEGWAEVDTLCQSNWKAEILLSNWPAWEKLLNKFVIDRNIHKRRASLVILNKAIRQSDDTRLSEMVFKNIELLKHEKNILITKAISWLLRSLIDKHRLVLEKYLLKNEVSLPKIAVREVKNKLKTGKKSGLR